MKSKFTKLLMLVMVVASIGMVSSCKDYDEDRYNDLSWKLQDQNASLKNYIDAQKELLLKADSALKQALDTIQSCHCTGEGKCTCNIPAAIAKYVLENNITDETKVAQMIKDSILAHPGLTKAEVQEMINKVPAQILASEELSSLIKRIALEINHADSVLTYTLAGHVAQHCDSIKANSDSIKSLIELTSELNKTILEVSAKAKSAYKLAQDDSTAIVGILTAIDSISTWGPKITAAATAAENAMAQALTTDTLLQKTINTFNGVAAQLAKKDSLLGVEDSLLKIKYTELSGDLTDVAERLDSLVQESAKYATKAEVKNLRDSLTVLYDSLDNYVTKELLNDTLEYYVTDKELKDELKNYATHAWTELKLAQLKKAYEKADKALGERIDAVELQIDTLKNRVTAVEKSISNILDAMKKQVTSLLIQEVNNPIFGAYSYPNGISTKVLAAYFGTNDNEVEFPTSSTINYVVKENALTDKDIEMLGGVQLYTAGPQSTLVNEEAGNAGKVYVTVNPNTTNFTGKTLTVVNSQDEAALVKLSPLAKSDYVITFGHRSASNGFYEAAATFSADDMEALKLKADIDTAALKQITKNVYNSMKGINSDNYTSKIRSGLTSFANAAAAYSEAINAMFLGMEAYALKATWTDTLGEHSVVSPYEMAVTAYQPLSFAFLKDRAFGKLPHFTSLADKLKNKINNLTFNFDPIHVHINGATAEVKFQKIELDALGQLKSFYLLPEVDPVTGQPTGSGWEYWIPVDGTDAWKADFENEINTKLGISATDIEKEINEQVNEVIDQINAQMNDVNVQIGTQLSSNINDLKNKAKNGITKVTNKLNKFVDALNSRLDNLNAYLQVAALYDGGDGLHSLSTNKAFPTVLKKTAAGEEGINFYLTTLSAELFAPAFKKHFAVTNVFKGGLSAQGGDTDCKSVLDAANAQEGMNEVLDRDALGNVVTFITDKTGYVFEIAYSALDYSGKISTRKYYVTVK